ncbi:MAG: Nif3-like dinuclear metal center hexameric protein [Ruminococcaceae bacterium]|nr:Nif3-like dinuclear metal center hexameric protein [Oscillospiraceae bacterium]
MTQIKNIYEYLDSVAPFLSQADWDNSGLLVGDMSKKVSKVLLSLDITESVVDEAKASSCELIISHHPVIFSPLSQIDSSSIVYKLIKSDVCALCAHTNLDIAKNIGVNECLAKALGLNDTTLYPEDFLCVGTLEKAISSDEFAKHVKECLNCNGVRYTKGQNIKTVAVSSGGGSEAVTFKEKYNFDAVVTGEIKHHHFLYAQDKGFCCVEAGHFSTEDIVVAPLLEKLSATFSDVTFTKSKSLADPVRFI